MSSIAIIESSFAHLFISHLKQMGYPVQDWLASARLPLSLMESTDGYVSEYHLRKFMVDAIDRTGMHDLGLLVAEKATMLELGKLVVQMKGEENLYKSLELFCRNVSDVNSHATFWLSQHEGHTWFFRSNPQELNIGQHFAEQFTVIYMIKLVQLIVGNNWLPENVWLNATNKLGYSNHPYFNHCTIKTSRGMSAIMLPDIKGVEVENQQQLITPEIQTPTLSSTLTKLLKPYLRESYPDIELATELSRLKVRTLKRRLADENINYRDLVQQVRLELAFEMLQKPENKIIDVAQALSYANPGNFTRAFHRWTGMTPHEYQSLHHRM